MWYLIFLGIVILIIFLTSKTQIKYIYEDGWRVEMHFVFFSVHFTKGKNKKRPDMRISPGNALRATNELLEKSTVILSGLSIPVNSSATVPNIRFLGINISYPLIYAYLSATSRKLIISENAVIKETTENFKFFVNISLQVASIHLIRSLFYLFFTTTKKREA